MSLLGRFYALISVVILFLVASAAPATVDERAAQDVIDDVLNFFKSGFVTQINTEITLDSLVTDLVSINFDVKNDLPFELTIDRVVSKAGVEGTVYVEFDRTFPNPVVVPPSSRANSGWVPDVLFTQGALASLFLINLQYLDLIESDVYVRALTNNGTLGTPIPITGLTQEHVPARLRPLGQEPHLLGDKRMFD
ncbi:hypothetical protein DL96DRAFT_1818254 [Flagelloscypha sp. PMI_526]|nr:hypothetical protein DL96DRAFT_1818254 [Flagelloscypha sp. PMI_526]